MAVFEHIEKLKREYTDKFVVVNDEVCELKRFQGLTGTVRTVNMSGRALVEFEGHNNIGWYDIDVDFLSVVDKPAPAELKKPAAKEVKAAAKPSKAPSKLEQARSGGAKPAPAKPGAMSVEQMLAAARSEKGGAAPAGASGGDSKASLQQQLEAARQTNSAAKPPAKTAAKPAAAAAKVDPKGMSVEQMLAAARAEKGGAASSPAEAAPQESGPQETGPAEEQPSATTAESAASATEASATEAASAGGGRRNDITDVEAQLAYCRQVDG